MLVPTIRLQYHLWRESWVIFATTNKLWTKRSFPGYFIQGFQFLCMSVQQKSFYLTLIAALHFLSANWAKIRIASSTSETPPQTDFFGEYCCLMSETFCYCSFSILRSSRYDFWDHIPVKSMNRVEAPNTPIMTDLSEARPDFAVFRSGRALLNLVMWSLFRTTALRRRTT